MRYSVVYLNIIPMFFIYIYTYIWVYVVDPYFSFNLNTQCFGVKLVVISGVFRNQSNVDKKKYGEIFR